MHLRLSDQELATLVEMVSLAANVASWNQKESANEKITAFEELESKILEKAGVDVHQASFWQGGFDVLNELVSELEKLPIKH